MQPQRRLFRPYLAEQIQAFVNSAHQDIDRLCSEHRRATEQTIAELTALRLDHAELRETVRDVVAALRAKADREVAEIRRQLEAALLRLTRRDPNAALN